MTGVPAAMFAATTVLQYTKRSYRTRHAPAGISSHDAKLSVIAIAPRAPSAVTSNCFEYGVALITSSRPMKRGWKVQKASMTSSGDRARVRCAPSCAADRCCSQYQSQTDDKLITSLPILTGNGSRAAGRESRITAAGAA